MIDAVSALSGQAAPSVPAARPSADLQQQANRFNEMMAQEPDPSIYTEQHLQKGGSPVSAFINAQEGVMRQTFDKVQAFVAEAPHLGMHDLVARQMELQQQMVTASLQLHSATYIAQSGKSGLQTLMKNQ